MATNTAVPAASTETAVETTEEVPVVETTEETSETTETKETASSDAKAEAEIKKLEDKSKLTKKEEKRLNKLKLKVDGKEFDEELPFELPADPKAVEYLTKQLQMAKMGSKRAQDFTSLQKEAAQFIERLRTNPFEVLQDPDLGVDVKQQVKAFIEKELENQKKSPEQLEKEKLEAKLKELQEEREREKKELNEKEFKLLQQKAEEEYDRQITEAIANSSLPKSEYAVKRVVDWMLLGLQEGLDIQASDVIPLVEAQMKKELQDMFAVMPEDVMESLIGKDKLGKMRKKNIEKAKQVMTSKAPDVGKKAKAEETAVDKKIAFKDFFGL